MVKVIACELNLEKYDVKSLNVRNKINAEYLNNVLDIINRVFDNLKYNTRKRKNVLFDKRNLYKKYLKLYRNNLV